MRELRPKDHAVFVFYRPSGQWHFVASVLVPFTEQGLPLNEFGSFVLKNQKTFAQEIYVCCSLTCVFAEITEKEHSRALVFSDRSVQATDKQFHDHDFQAHASPKFWGGSGQVFVVDGLFFRPCAIFFG